MKFRSLAANNGSTQTADAGATATGFHGAAELSAGVAIRLLRSILMSEKAVLTESAETAFGLDTEFREVIATGDLADALDAADAWNGWRRASFTDQKEYIEAIDGAKRPEIKAKRIAIAVAFAKANKGKA